MSINFKNILKNTFLLFVFSFFFTLISLQNTNAYTLDNNACRETNVTATKYVITSADLNGFFPICFYDADTTNDLNIRLDTQFGDIASATIQSTTASGNTVGQTTSVFKGGGTTTVEWTKNFSVPST